MLLRHLGSAMDAARIAAGAHPLVVFVAHQHEAGFPVLGENIFSRFARKRRLRAASRSLPDRDAKAASLVGEVLGDAGAGKDDDA